MKGAFFSWHYLSKNFYSPRYARALRNILELTKHTSLLIHYEDENKNNKNTFQCSWWGCFDEETVFGIQ